MNFRIGKFRGNSGARKFCSDLLCSSEYHLWDDCQNQTNDVWRWDQWWEVDKLLFLDLQITPMAKKAFKEFLYSWQLRRTLPSSSPDHSNSWFRSIFFLTMKVKLSYLAACVIEFIRSLANPGLHCELWIDITLEEQRMTLLSWEFIISGSFI